MKSTIIKLCVLCMIILVHISFADAQSKEESAFDLSLKPLAPTPYNIGLNFIHSGFMECCKQGGVEACNFTGANSAGCRNGDTTCIKIVYTACSLGWGGSYWQYPANNWGASQGLDFSQRGFSKITFWARGDAGGEIIKFKAGGINSILEIYKDSFVIPEEAIELSQNWTQFELSLAGADLSNVLGGFMWVVPNNMNDTIVTFYLDDIQFE